MNTARARLSRRLLLFCAALLIPCLPRSAMAQTPETPNPAQVRDTMRRATDFMMNSVSNRGGFVWAYTLDLEPFGELPARKSMIWVEPPGTPSVGLVLLEAYRATGDAVYLDYAKRVVRPLIWGQHPSGGWNYFIDFDPHGLPEYYETFLSKCWGWWEHVHPYDNCTFDDFVTTESTRFLLRFYAATLDPELRGPLDKALDHILRAQYPNGAWPQRYPPGKPHSLFGRPDYTSFYTFNDGVMSDCIDFMLEAAETLSRPDCRAAAIRGMDFYLLAQLPGPQAGWAQQYSPDMKPAWGRPFEIATICAGESVSCIDDLMRFYALTGDRRYLDAVPPALDWLERSIIPGAEGYTHTYYYEADSNKPLYIRQEGEAIEEVTYTVTNEVEGSYPYGNRMTLDVGALRREYERVSALSAEEPKADYEDRLRAKPLPKAVLGGFLAKALAETQQSPDGINAIVNSLDTRGGWQELIHIPDPFSPFTKPGRDFTGYSTGGYIGRMYRLINYLDAFASRR
ncbi:MAG: pectate lyase [Candidatus Hydrogenedentes bacterium]|nr:pectate lyase [Candidatus Hydrogenedentota bacterium]